MKASTRGYWSAGEAIHHINYLELLAAFLVLKPFASNKLQKGPILLRMDNISAVTYINQKRGTHSNRLSNLALEIWERCLQRQLTIQAEHLPTRQTQLGHGLRVHNNERSVQLDDKFKGVSVNLPIAMSTTNRPACISPDKVLYTYKFLRDVIFEAFAINWPLAKFSSFKFH